jgi:hypothetical protein
MNEFHISPPRRCATAPKGRLNVVKVARPHH